MAQDQTDTPPFEPLVMSEQRRFAAFLTVIIAVVLEVADSTIVNTALPAIRQALDASAAEMQWIVAGYLLVLGSLLLLGGRLGDALGHSRVFLWGVGGFVLASVLCGLAQDATQLVLARLVQGAAGAFMAPQTMALVQLLYTPIERITRMAYFGVIVGLAAIIGPIAGGLLIELDLFGLGWRAIFLINLPVGLNATGLPIGMQIIHAHAQNACKLPRQMRHVALQPVAGVASDGLGEQLHQPGFVVTDNCQYQISRHYCSTPLTLGLRAINH